MSKSTGSVRVMTPELRALVSEHIWQLTTENTDALITGYAEVNPKKNRTLDEHSSVILLSVIGFK